MFRTLEIYLRRILDFLTYSKNYFIRNNPFMALANTLTAGIKDFLTVKKKLKMAQYRLNYNQHMLQKMESLIAQNSEHSFLKGTNLDQKR